VCFTPWQSRSELQEEKLKTNKAVMLKKRTIRFIRKSFSGGLGFSAFEGNCFETVYLATLDVFYTNAKSACVFYEGENKRDSRKLQPYICDTGKIILTHPGFCQCG
jgi:hypothetical protein